MATEDLPERILSFLGQKDYRPQRIRVLARNLGIAEHAYGDFRDTVKALMKTGRLVLGGSRQLTLPEPSGVVRGQFRLNPRGFGFVIPEQPDAHGDLFVPPDKRSTAVTGDTVLAKVVKRGKRNGKMLFEGRIIEIVTRGRNHFVGELCLELRRWFVQPDGKILHAPVFIDDPSAKGARAGDQVVVEVLQYPGPGVEARGVIIRVLGKRGEPDVDTLSIIVQYQLPEAFPDDVLAEASEMSRAFDLANALPDRDDLRAMTIITIDPVDARDFDDAISLTPTDDGHVELGVHIADVAHFVREGSRLDAEARERSTSIYFPRHVIPMLPEVLSNGVCSLQEGVPRLAKSAFITYEPNTGRVVRARFANSVIASAQRLAYEEAQAILDGSREARTTEIAALLRSMDSLARAIRNRRLKEGMLVLNLPDVDLIFDDENRVTGAQPADASFTHTIIEMFMVEANEAVARRLVELGVPHLRRIHPDPDDAAGVALAKFLAALGIKVPKNLDRFAMQALLKRVADEPAGFAVNLALLRSLQQAEYAPALTGHFALASSHYLHFTSPIRRYPDLTAHRLLDAHLAGRLAKPRDHAAFPNLDEVRHLGNHCSQNERRAEDAERELRLVKILELLEKRVGDSLQGIVTGVTSFGMYIQLREYLVDGLLRFEELADDWWEVDTARGCVVAERSGQRIRIGQELEVVVMLVDIAGRQVNLTLGEPSHGRGKARIRAARPKAARKKGPSAKTGKGRPRRRR